MWAASGSLPTVIDTVASLSRKQTLGPIVIGLGGFAVLIALGFWQVDRLQWKRGIIDEAERRITAPPQALPAELDPERDDYMPVFVTGSFDHDDAVYFLTSQKPTGPGFEVIAPFDAEDGRRILVNRGYIPQDEKGNETGPNGPVRVEGVLRWPSDINSFTPDPDAAKRIFYSREVGPLSDATGALPIMLMQAPTDAAQMPRGQAVAVVVRNHHLQYAITWFSISLIWIVMTVLWYRRLRLARSA